MKIILQEYQKTKIKKVINSLKALLFSTLFALLIISCNKDDKLFSGNDQLPQETQTGANTVGCLVNGQVFLPHDQGLNYGINCFYQFIDNEFYFNITCTDFRGTIPKGVTVQTRKINLQINQIYILNKNIINNGDFDGCGGNYDIGSNNRFFTNTIKTGELKITRLDLSNSIISGTFWFDAINSTGETVEVRQGRFDMNY